MARRALLLKIYAPAFGHLAKGTPEYDLLARSGTVWERYFRPMNIEPYSQAQAQADLKHTFKDIGALVVGLGVSHEFVSYQ